MATVQNKLLKLGGFIMGRRILWTVLYSLIHFFVFALFDELAGVERGILENIKLTLSGALNFSVGYWLAQRNSNR